MCKNVKNRIWTSNHSGTSKLLLLALNEKCLGMDTEDGFCWPSYETLSEMIGVSPEGRQAMKSAKKLVESGDLMIWHQGSERGGRGYSNIFLITTGLNEAEILERIERRFDVSPDEARAIHEQSGDVYVTLRERGVISASTLKRTKKAGVSGNGGQSSLPENSVQSNTDSQNKGVQKGTDNQQNSVQSNTVNLENSVQSNTDNKERVFDRSEKGVRSNTRSLKEFKNKNNDDIESLFLYFCERAGVEPDSNIQFCERAGVEPDSNIQEKNFVAGITDLYILADDDLVFAKSLVDFGIEFVDRDDNDYILRSPDSIYQVCKTEAGKRKRQRRKTAAQTAAIEQRDAAPPDPGRRLFGDFVRFARSTGIGFADQLSYIGPPNSEWRIGITERALEWLKRPVIIERLENAAMSAGVDVPLKFEEVTG